MSMLRQEYLHDGFGRRIGERIENAGGCGPGTVAGTTFRHVLVRLDRDPPGVFPAPFNASELSDEVWNASVEP